MSLPLIAPGTLLTLRASRQLSSETHPSPLFTTLTSLRRKHPNSHGHARFRTASPPTSTSSSHPRELGTGQSTRARSSLQEIAPVVA